jgi:hypothetical protein
MSKPCHKRCNEIGKSGARSLAQYEEPGTSQITETGWWTHKPTGPEPEVKRAAANTTMAEPRLSLLLCSVLRKRGPPARVIYVSAC